ncbi:MAG: hypothetical protein A2Z77_04640 [Chloroflexi bacterium RBG_13_51_36]|nr:MAG: hypothetical protein A2Z77_04640 [Chloroflexi bacterium RBG_13_51_36]
MSDLKTEFLCTVAANVDWRQVIDIGVTPHGIRQVVYIKGGKFEGPQIKGVVLPGGGDWFVRRADQMVELDVRCVLRTDDNHLIYCCLKGINEMPAEVAIKAITGQPIDSSQYYFRVTTVIETGSKKYGWLNRIVAVGVGNLTLAGVEYKIYTLL